MVHDKGEWIVIRVAGITIAQGYKCSCGAIGCRQQNVPEAEHSVKAYNELKTLIALDFHAGEQ